MKMVNQTFYFLSFLEDINPVAAKNAKKMEEDLLPQEHLLYKRVLREFLKRTGKKILLLGPVAELQN